MTQPQQQQQQINYEAVAIALQERVGQLVQQYETDIALLRANATEVINNLQGEVQRLQNELAEKEGTPAAAD